LNSKKIAKHSERKNETARTKPTPMNMHLKQAQNTWNRTLLKEKSKSPRMRCKVQREQRDQPKRATAATRKRI
jgi:hypothetical protein